MENYKEIFNCIWCKREIIMDYLNPLLTTPHVLRGYRNTKEKSVICYDCVDHLTGVVKHSRRNDSERLEDDIQEELSKIASGSD